jgi:hypothetical protein
LGRDWARVTAAAVRRGFGPGRAAAFAAEAASAGSTNGP